MYDVIGIKEVIGTVLVIDPDVDTITSDRVKQVLSRLQRENPLIAIESEELSISRVKYVGEVFLEIRKGAFHLNNIVGINRFKKCYFSTDLRTRKLLEELVEEIK